MLLSVPDLLRGDYEPVGDRKVVRRRGRETKTRCCSSAVDGQNGIARPIRKDVDTLVDARAAAVSPIGVILRCGHPRIHRAQSVFSSDAPPARTLKLIQNRERRRESCSFSAGGLDSSLVASGSAVSASPVANAPYSRSSRSLTSERCLSRLGPDRL